MFKQKKRGQVTTFIMVGIIILIAIGLFAVFRATVPPFQIEPEVPEEIKPIAMFTDACLEDIAEQGIFLLSSQGGYINPEATFPDLPYQRDAFITTPLMLPLWYYRGRDRMPSYAEMEQELAEFISSRVMECLDGYTEFSNEYAILALGAHSVTTSINDHDVTIALNYPLEIKPRVGATKMKWDRFVVQHESSLGMLYALAADIMAAENSNAFLEELVIDMIANADEFPYEGMEFTCRPRQWSFRQIQNDIKEHLLPANLQFVTFTGTNYQESGFEYYDRLYRIPVGHGTRSYPDIKVDIVYNPEWDLNLDVTPRNGDRIKPIETTFTRTTFGCVKLYHHLYSLDFPVQFRLVDVASGEEFYFATPVMIQNNIPDRRNAIIDWPASDLLDSEEYCSDTITVTRYVTDESTGQIIAYPDEEVEKELIPIKVLAVNKYYQGQQVIPNVTVSYQCARYLCGGLGVTEFPVNEQGLYTYGAPLYEGMFPECIGGHFIGNKNGFLEGRAQHDVLPETAHSQVTIEMVEKKDKRYTAKVVEDISGSQVVRDLRDGEEMLILLSNDELELEQYLFMPSEADRELFLLMGEYSYELDIKLIKEGSVIGGAFLEEWQPAVEDVAAKQEVVFYATRQLNVQPPNTEEEYRALWDFAVANTREPDLR